MPESGFLEPSPMVIVGSSHGTKLAFLEGMVYAGRASCHASVFF